MKIQPSTSHEYLRKRVRKHGLQSVNIVRSLLPQVIQLETGMTVIHLTDKYFRIVDKWMKAEGKRSSVLRLKNVFLLALRSLVDDPISLPYIKTNRRGFPRKFEFLETFYRNQGKSPQAMQAVLSVLGYYRNILAPGIPDLSSITNQGPIVPSTLIEEIIELGFDPSWKINPKRIDPVKLELRSKRGPNGQATICAFQDLSVLPDNLVNSLTKILSKSFDEDNTKMTISSTRKKLPKDTIGCHSRLAIKREKGGKDRIFAMVDYWTQVTLKPLHNQLSKILKCIPQDCTYDQNAGIDQMKLWTTSGSAISVDLSSASDRFPMSLQVAIMERLIDGDFSQAWRELMVDRDFIYKGKPYRWAVGQPLGAHSSWPSFALAHHVVMRAAHKKAGIPFEYLLLGDDMAARNNEAIVHYLSYLNSLGVEISTTKGLSAHSCEFAKRIFYRGHEVSPVPVPMIEAMVKDQNLLPEFLSKIHERSSDKKSDLRVSEFILHLSDKLKWNMNTLSILSQYPLPQMRSVLRSQAPSLIEVMRNVTWNSRTFSCEEVWEVFNDVRYRNLIRQLDNLTREARVKATALNKVELPATPTGIRRMHPLFYAYGNYFDEVDSARAEVRGYLASSDRWAEVPLVHVTNVTSLLKGSRKGAKHSAKLLLEVYNELCTRHPEPTLEEEQPQNSLKQVS